MEECTDVIRFMDLPAELRDKIYRELLCSFTFHEEPRTRPDSTLGRMLNHSQQSNINEATTSASTSILLVSRAVHREAYNVMVKSNRFIRVKGLDFNWTDILPRAQIPIVSMDRNAVARFKGYVACLTVDDHFGDVAEEQARGTIFFDFMILERHWDLLCRSISYMYRQTEDLRIRLTFNPNRTNEESYCRIPFDSSFMAKVEQELVQAPQTYWRGIESITIEGLMDAHLGEVTKTRIAETPWADKTAWMAQLEEKVAPLKNFRAHGDVEDVVKAFNNFEDIITEAQYISDRYPDGPAYLFSRIAQIEQVCSTGVVRCYLHILETSSLQKSDFRFKTMVTHTHYTLRAFPGGHRPEIRAQSKMFEAQLRRILGIEMGQSTDLQTAQQIAQLLLQAEELDPVNEEIKGEQEKFLEMSGLKPLRIRDIAAAL